ncbi:zinc ABC transporter ATP-binding protein ZnuC [Solemya velesiana gill symbiont]|uniref:Zinc ABC transporter ATP-binding protein n=1 Tax=Solemya velesiana gill symbiont TaxID=1918948 RepID=A0A1T2KS76_9GAMM|nr:zinc ABC transporter ATP-binding protein ZnuC [Solemya velesiana gill symbiont]OOZ35718.1 zinc ABC transporter ATP-binding protein [Solemya velesiana gill symbiont]
MNSPQEPLISAQDIGIRLNGRDVLERVDLSVSRNEIVTLIGPNGAGKTTLVRILLGLLQPDRGSVHLQDDLKIGYMPQRLSLPDNLPLTVQQFLTLTGSATSEKLTGIANELNINHLLKSPMQTLSGGEHQRVLLARALLRDPDLLVLDEPVQGVDVTGQSELYSLITRIRDQHQCGVLMISHDLHLVMAATDRVTCINRHVCCSGHPEAVSRHPAYLELFGAHTSSKLAVYTHHHDHTHDIHGAVVPDEEHHHG